MHRALVLSLFLFAAACGKAAPAPAHAPAVPVRTAKVQSSDIPVEHRYPALLASPRPVQLTARVAGYLRRQRVPDGSRVKTGDVIYEIDPSQYLAQLASAEAQLASAEAARAFAVDEVERNKPLVEVGAISEQDFDKLVTNAREAEANVLNARAQVDLQRLNVSYCVIASPLDGMLGKSQQYEGSMVGPGYATDLNLVVQTDPMWAQFSPSSTEWPQYLQLLSAGSLQAKVTYGLHGPQASGKVIFRNNEVAQQTSSLLMRVEFPDPNGVFIPGALAEVEVGLSVMKGALSVPMDALWARETRLFVWRVKADNTVESVEVDVPLRQEGSAVVVGSIKAGDTVVVAGVQKLREGVAVTEAPPAHEDKPGTAGAPRPEGAPSATGHGS